LKFITNVQGHIYCPSHDYTSVLECLGPSTLIDHRGAANFTFFVQMNIRALQVDASSSLSKINFHTLSRDFCLTRYFFLYAADYGGQ